MKIKWTEDLSTGVDEIDGQHKDLIDKIDRLLASCHEGASKEEASSMLEFLESYVVDHFNAEEELMIGKGYSGFVAHKKEHSSFMAEIEQIKLEAIKDGMSSFIVIRINKRIVGWLINHIRKTDKLMGRTLNDKTG